jgi:transcriptional regulator with XRE-family HTH domain
MAEKDAGQTGQTTGQTMRSDAGFAERLQAARQRVGISQNQLARQVGIDPSYLNRIERGERAAPAREVVEALAEALALSDAEADDLLVSAGHLIRALARLGPLDPTIRLVAEALGDPQVSTADRAALRECLALIVPRFRYSHGVQERPNE